MRSNSFLAQNAPYLAVGAILTFLSSFGQTFFISIFAGEIRATYGLSHGQWGGIYMLGTSCSAVVMVWAGGLTDLFRVRVLGPSVLIGLSGACLAMAFNPWVGLLPVVIFALRFFGQGMTSHIAVVAMARWFVAKRGRALSVASLGMALGEATLPIIFVALMTIVDWRLLWVSGALIALCGVPILAYLLGKERTPSSLALGDSSLGMLGRHWRRGQALRHPLFWMMVPALLGPGAFGTAFFFHQVHLAEIKQITHVELVSFFPVYTVVGIAALIVTGGLLDRYGTARLMPFYQLPMAVAFLAFSVSDGPWMFAFGFVLLGASTGANSTLPNAFWAEFYGTAHIGSIKALAAAVSVLGSAIGPGLTGVLIDFGVGLEKQFVGIAAYFVVASVITALGISRASRDLTANSSPV